jgi:hypothetical protein
MGTADGMARIAVADPARASLLGSGYGDERDNSARG